MIKILQQLLDIIQQIFSAINSNKGNTPTQDVGIEQNTPTQDIESEEQEYVEIDKEYNITHLRQMLAFDEGKVLKIYRDSLGFYTVGIGHLLTKENSKQRAIQVLDQLVGRSTDGIITDQESAMIFEKDLVAVVQGVKNNDVLKSVYDILDPIRRLALMNMVFQLGINGTANFKNSMRIAKEGDWSKLKSNLEQSLWYKQTRNRASRVIAVFTSGTTEAYNKFI